MEAALPLAGLGLALGWPLEWVVQRFPLGTGTPASRARLAALAAATAAVFAALALAIGPEPRLLPALLLVALVVPAAAIDLHHRIIPDRLNLPGAVAVYAVAVAAQPDRALELAVGGLAAFLLLGLAWFVHPKGMGLGDVKMALMIGLALGTYVTVALVAAFVFSAVLSFGLLAARGAAARKIGFPFGPFLAAGALVAHLWGPELWAWYVGAPA
jgi:leader peptidase (prepilin peptidase)/N-methyltransferase